MVRIISGESLMLDYKSIIIKWQAMDLSYKELGEEFGASKSGMNGFICTIEMRKI